MLHNTREVIEVHVADNGPRIPDDQKETVFGEEEQGLDSSGTGMGLHLVARIVSILDDEVWIKNNEPEGRYSALSYPQYETAGTRKSVASALTEAPVSTNYKKFECYDYDAQSNGGVVR
jgi:K+-sensing histidine kinase KdpD